MQFQNYLQVCGVIKTSPIYFCVYLWLHALIYLNNWPKEPANWVVYFSLTFKYATSPENVNGKLFWSTVSYEHQLTVSDNK
jgi:hypothetical protein